MAQIQIQVVSAKDGRHELITLTEPLTLVEGETLNRIVTGTRVEHWFTPEGAYDGWGMDVSAEDLNASEARQLIEAVEAGRRFPPTTERA